MKLSIVGAGGFAREVVQMIGIRNHEGMSHFPHDENIRIMGLYVESEYLPASDAIDIDYLDYRSNVTIAIGNSNVRKRLVEKVLNKNTVYYTLIPYDITINDFWARLDSPGTIIARGNLFTTNIKIGKHTIINLGCTIGHDVIIGNYCTISPGCNISGNVKIGECVEIGTNTCIKENISICSNVIIGMGSVVIKDITSSGTYYGNPAKIEVPANHRFIDIG